MPKNRWARPIMNPYVIRMDGDGSGRFNAPRSGGRRHKGVDFLVVPGSPIYSPITGRVTREAIPYDGDTTYKGCEIVGSGAFSGFRVKMFYMIPTAVGDNVQRGQVIGYAQDIRVKYAPGPMQAHIHFEVYKNGVLQNPELIYTDLKPQA